MPLIRSKGKLTPTCINAHDAGKVMVEAGKVALTMTWASRAPGLQSITYCDTRVFMCMECGYMETYAVLPALES